MLMLGQVFECIRPVSLQMALFLHLQLGKLFFQLRTLHQEELYKAHSVENELMLLSHCVSQIRSFRFTTALR